MKNKYTINTVQNSFKNKNKKTKNSKLKKYFSLCFLLNNKTSIK